MCKNGKQMNKLWYIHTMDDYIIIKNCVEGESLMNESVHKM